MQFVHVSLFKTLLNTLEFVAIEIRMQNAARCLSRFSLSIDGQPVYLSNSDFDGLWMCGGV